MNRAIKTHVAEHKEKKEETHRSAEFRQAKVQNPNSSVWSVCIPLQVAQTLELKKGDMVLVAIKKASLEEIQEYTKVKKMIV
jgi:hypothetical protein